MSFLSPGNKLGKYELVEFVGSGATAEVWSCRNGSDRLSAIKIFAPQLGLDKYGIQELKRVFMDTKGISHSNILPPTDFGEYNNRAYFIFDKLCEGNLANDFKQRWMDASGGEYGSSQSNLFSEEEVAEIILQVGSGLNHLHTVENMVHLDVKPSNILFTTEPEFGDRQYVLHDLDISVDLKKTIMRVQPGEGSTGGFGMAPGYAAPEQFKSNYNPEYASDIFALGVSLFELTSGYLPGGEGAYGRNLTNDIRIPRITGNYSSGLRELIAACMQYKKEKRPNAELLVSAAQGFLNGNPWPKVKIDEPSKLPIKGISLLVFLIGLLSIVFFYGPKVIAESTSKDDAINLLRMGGKENWQSALSMLQMDYSQNSSPETWNQIENVKNILAQYSEVGLMTEHGVRVKKDNKMGYVSMDGDIIIPLNYTSIANEYKFGFIPVTKGNYTGICDLNGREVIKPKKYKGIAEIYKDYTASIGSNCFDLNSGGKKIECKN